MAISGTWAARSANARAYTGALRWGTGVNQIHAIRDNPGRVTGVKENLYPLADASDAVPDSLLDGDYFVGPDWDGDPYPGEDFRYQDVLPRWDETTPGFRDATLGNPVMGEWDDWGGPTITDDTRWEVGGISHGEEEERQNAIAVPTAGVAGGWRNKSHAAPYLPADNSAQAPGDLTAQWGLNTAHAQGQGVKMLDNTRALGRGTDTPREAVRSRVAGIRQYSPGTSFGMGGGPGTPDMQPFQQTAGLKRPFVMRAPGLPPEEDHFMNEMEGREPIQRTVPPDPYQGDNESGGQTGGTESLADEAESWY